MRRSRKKGKNRNSNVFGLAFMDCICCGFGAVILLFVLSNSGLEQDRREKTEDLRAEVDLIEKLIEEGQLNKVEIRNTIEETEVENVTTEGLSRQVIEDIKTITEELAESREDTTATREHVNQLQADVKSMEEEAKRLEEREEGKNIMETSGDGRRQYLSGLRVDGKRNVILLDRSASMVAESLEDILRLRSAPPERRRDSKKWQHVLAGFEWLVANLPPNTEFQVIVFSAEAELALPDLGGRWISTGDRATINRLISRVKQEAPHGGTNFDPAFKLMASLPGGPDNVFLLTDGLPTLSNSRARQTSVSGDERERIFNDAIALLPRNVPVNILLYPLKHDPAAAVEFWKLAVESGGSYLVPSPNWP